MTNKGGRPRKGARKIDEFRLRVDDKLYRRMREEADRLTIPTTAWVRMVLIEHLDARERKKEPSDD